MPHCHDMKKGDVYACAECGLELEVVTECTSCCGDDDCSCEFTCCGEPLKKKD